MGPEPESEPDLDDELSLVNEEVMETSVAFANMADNAVQRFSFVLAELGRRVTHLSGRASRNFEPENLPLGPWTIVHALEDAARFFDVSLEVKLIFF